MKRLNLHGETLELLEQPLRGLGVRPLSEVRALAEEPLTAAEQVLILIATDPSAGLRRLLRTVGLREQDLEVEARDGLDERAGNDRSPSRAVVLFDSLNLILALLGSILRAPVRSGSCFSCRCCGAAGLGSQRSFPRGCRRRGPSPSDPSWAPSSWPRPSPTGSRSVPHSGRC
jgi:hypothetical protein